MTLAKDAAHQLIAQFGEEVTVYPQSESEPEDVDDPVFFEQTSSQESSFTVKARVYTNPDDETLETYGFESSTEQMIYETNGNIDLADEVEIFGDKFIVDKVTSNQLGNGKYVFIYALVGV